MAEQKNKKTYWPHMIVGFLALAIMLSYWTVKSASSIPVQEVNQYMMKYQQADIHINEILEMKQAFDKEYTIKIQDIETMVMTDNVHSNRPQPNVIKLQQGSNDFTYNVIRKDGSVVSDANVSFLLTRPHSRRDDVMIENVSFDNGVYTAKGLEITKPGRYTLQLRAALGKKIGYSELSAYLNP